MGLGAVVGLEILPGELSDRCYQEVVEGLFFVGTVIAEEVDCLFLPLVWPHGPIGRLGGLRRPRPQNWPLTRDSGGRTA
jgi:hypothetical protein